MAFEIPLFDVAFTAQTDLSACQYHFVKVTGAVQCGSASGTTDTVIGVLQNKAGSAQAAQVRVFGISKLISSAAIGAGSMVATSATGLGVAVQDGLASGAAGAYVAGVALDTSTAINEVVSILLTHAGRGA